MIVLVLLFTFSDILTKTCTHNKTSKKVVNVSNSGSLGQNMPRSKTGTIFLLDSKIGSGSKTKN